jgi:alpha-N-arabinofuranosidase
MYTKRRTGISLQPVVQGPSYEGKTNGQVHYLDTSAILNDNTLHVFMTNRHLSENMTAQINVADRSIIALDSTEILTGPDPKAVNSLEQPDLVQSRPFQAVEIAGGLAKVTLPPLSVVAMTLRLGS